MDKKIISILCTFCLSGPLFTVLVMFYFQVNKLVAKGRTRNADGTQDLMQAALFESSFTKSFYFFPGVAEAES